MKTNIRFRSYLSQFFLDWKMFQTKVVENFETHILCPITFFFLENSSVYKTMWKNIVERGRPQMTIIRMRFACWIPKSRDTHTQNM